MGITAYDIRALNRAFEGRTRVTKRLIHAIIEIERIIVSHAEIGDQIRFDAQQIYQTSYPEKVVLKVLEQLYPDKEKYLVMGLTITSGDVFSDEYLGRCFRFPFQEPNLESKMEIKQHQGINRIDVLWIASHVKEIIAKFAQLNEERMSDVVESEDKLTNFCNKELKE